MLNINTRVTKRIRIMVIIITLESAMKIFKLPTTIPVIIKCLAQINVKSVAEVLIASVGRSCQGSVNCQLYMHLLELSFFCRLLCIYIFRKRPLIL